MFDLLIAGGGNAALCAAITAARKGASVLLVERAPKSYRGGNTRHTRNMRVAHESANEVLTGPYPVSEFMEDLQRVTAGNTNERLARLALEKSCELWPFLWEQGVRFQPSLGGTLSLSRTNAFFLGGGRTLLNTLYQRAEDLGVSIYYDTQLVDVEINDACFEAAIIECDGLRQRVEARSFIAASGGFEANIDWLVEAWGEAARNFLIRGTPYNKGELLRLLLDSGVAQTGDATQCHAVAIDGRAPAFDGGIATRLDCVPFGIVLNSDCERFYDEGEDFWPKRYAIWGRLIAAQPGQIGHVIIDAKSIDLFMPSLFPPLKADSLEELAAAAGLDADKLVAQVAAYNSACRPGSFDHNSYDDCCTQGLEPPKSHWARPIDTPPYYAYSLRPGITFTYLGVKIDERARMLMADGRASPNMLAAGEIMAGNILGQGYLAGTGMMIGGVFGRIAGEEAAAYVTG